VTKWIVIVAGIGIVGAVAFLHLNSAADDEVALACDQDAAERIAEHSGFGSAYEAGGGSLGNAFEIRLEGCTDLTDDGLDEMVVRLQGGTGSSAPMTIYSPQDAHWRPQIERLLSGSDIAKVTNAGVREIRAAYRPSDPDCCPSGDRSGLTRWNGSHFVYEPEIGIGDGRIRVRHSAVESIGGFDVRTGSPVEAADAFGTPSSYDRSGQLCEVSWTDIGLTINFVDLGGANPCRAAGAVGSATVSGDPAAQVGWTIGDRLHIGATQEEIRSEFPRMTPMPIYTSADEQVPPGRDWPLETRPTRSGGGARTISLAVRLNNGEAVAYAAYVGAGG
jgi:hypothetical protein